MNKFTSLVRRAPKRFSALVAIIAAAVIIPVAVNAYGPERPTFTYEQPAPYVTFNSITNNPSVGDERNFVRVREEGTNTNFGNEVTLQPGKTYSVNVYYHNNASTSLNASGAGIAKDVSLRMQMPSSIAAKGADTVDGFINSSNAKPTSVWDSASLKNGSNGAVALRYIAGSAKVTSNGAVNGATLPDAFLTTGTPLGYDALNGTLKGCNEFAGYVTYKFTVVQPNFNVEKTVSVDGGKTFTKSGATTPGSTVIYKVAYTNTGSTQQDNVSLKDKLPAGVTYLPGTSVIANSKTAGKYQATSDGITTTGLTIGSYAPNGGNAFFKFSATAPAADALKCGANTLTNTARATTSGGYKESTADITINKECAPVVKYTCDALSVNRISRTEFKFTTTTSQQNATFKNVTYVIRDANGKEVERKTSVAKTLNYTKNTVGKYSVEAIVTFSVDGKDKTVTSAACKQAFEVPATPQEYCPIPGKEHLPKNSPDCKETPKEYCPIPGKEQLPKDSPDCVETPVTPPELPHTGASENIVAVVGLGALIASISYYVASRRALNQ